MSIKPGPSRARNGSCVPTSANGITLNGGFNGFGPLPRLTPDETPRVCPSRPSSVVGLDLSKWRRNDGLGFIPCYRLVIPLLRETTSQIVGHSSHHLKS